MKEKHFVKSNGRTYQWVDVEELKNEEILTGLERDAHHADSGMVVSLLAFVVFICSAISAGLFAGIIRTVALKANPSVDLNWLGDELQIIMLMAAMWLIVMHMIVLTVGIKCARVIANSRQ